MRSLPNTNSKPLGHLEHKESSSLPMLCHSMMKQSTFISEMASSMQLTTISVDTNFVATATQLKTERLVCRLSSDCNCSILRYLGFMEA